MNKTKLCKKNIEELRKEQIELLREQFNLRMQKISGKTIQSHLYKKNRRNIARIKTLLNKDKKFSSKKTIS